MSPKSPVIIIRKSHYLCYKRLLFILKWKWTLPNYICQHIGWLCHPFLLLVILLRIQNLFHHHWCSKSQFSFPLSPSSKVTDHERSLSLVLDLLELCCFYWFKPLTTLLIFSSGSHVAVEFIKQSRDCYYVKVQNLLKWTTWMMMMVFLFKNYVKVYDD